MICMCISYLLNIYVTGYFFNGSFGGNSILIITHFPYNYNSAIQWGCQLLLKLYINGLYVYCIFAGSLDYKGFLFFLRGSFGVDILLILTDLPYNPYSAIQGGCQLLLKLYITDLYAYCIFFGYFCYKGLISCLCWSFVINRLLVLTNFSYNSNSSI